MLVKLIEPPLAEPHERWCERSVGDIIAYLLLDYNIYLLHKGGSTVVFENHDEYDTSFLNTYVLARNEVKEGDSARGCLEWASRKDYDINGEGYTPVYVPTDPSGIRVLTGNGDYAQDWEQTVMNVDVTKGRFF
ncbi:MAG: hypothetical protein K6G58_07640 [Lachnospiraceae bacterium]|nr:hypothetical protein [Lachnospiraceae bacterium]